MILSKKEISDLKKEVKEVTGLKLENIEITAVSADFIDYVYYETKLFKLEGIKSSGRIQRKTN